MIISIRATTTAIAGVSVIFLPGCAIMPDPEPESTLSYAEIVQQIACETYFAVRRIETEPLGMWANLRAWSYNVSIDIQNPVEIGASLGGSFQNNKSTRYHTWMLGGPASPGSLNYDGQGIPEEKTSYDVSVATLFKTGKVHGKPSDELNEHFTCTFTSPAGDKWEDLGKPGGPVNSAIHPEYFSNGVFGVYDFLERVVAAGEPLGAEPTTPSYSKELKFKFGAGATYGWFIPLNSISAAAGANYLIDDKVTLSYKSGSPSITGPKFLRPLDDITKQDLVAARTLNAIKSLNQELSRVNSGF